MLHICECAILVPASHPAQLWQTRQPNAYLWTPLKASEKNQLPRKHAPLQTYAPKYSLKSHFSGSDRPKELIFAHSHAIRDFGPRKSANECRRSAKENRIGSDRSVVSVRSWTVTRPSLVAVYVRPHDPENLTLPSPVPERCGEQLSISRVNYLALDPGRRQRLLTGVNGVVFRHNQAWSSGLWTAYCVGRQRCH